MPANQSSPAEDDVELPDLPPLEADDDPDVPEDYSELFARLETGSQDDDASLGEFELGIELPTLELSEEPDEELEAQFELGSLLNVPGGDDEDDSLELEVGALVSISASASDDYSDDAEGPLDTPSLDPAELPDLGAEPQEDDLVTSEFELSEPDEVVEPWTLTDLTEVPSVALHAGTNLLSGGAGVWDLSREEQLSDVKTRDVCAFPNGIIVLDATGRLWRGTTELGLSSRTLQIEAIRDSDSVLALTLEGTLYRVDAEGVQPLPGAPQLTRLGRRSFPTLGVSRSDRLCRSLDGGLSWSPIETEPPPLAWLRSHDLKLHCFGSLIALGAERIGLALSTDGGISFSELSGLVGLTALASGRVGTEPGSGMKLFAACYDAALDESRIYSVDPLLLDCKVIATIAPREPEQDPRVRDLCWLPERGLLAAGDFGVIRLEPGQDAPGSEPV